MTPLVCNLNSQGRNSTDFSTEKCRSPYFVVVPKSLIVNPNLRKLEKAVAVRNSLEEEFSGKFRRCWIFRQHKMLPLPRFGHFLARKMAAVGLPQKGVRKRGCNSLVLRLFAFARVCACLSAFWVPFQRA